MQVSLVVDVLLILMALAPALLRNASNDNTLSGMPAAEIGITVSAARHFDGLNAHDLVVAVAHDRAEHGELDDVQCVQFR